MSQPPPIYDADYSTLADPNTSPEELHRIASTRFDLHPFVLAHPAVYPEMVAWIAQVNPQVVATPQPVVVPAQPADVSAGDVPTDAVPAGDVLAGAVPTGDVPAEKPPKKRTGLAVGIVGAVVLALVVAGGAWWFYFKPGSSTSYATLPSQGAMVSVATFGPDVRLTPIGSGDATLDEVDGTRLIGIQSGPTFGIAGVATNDEAVVPQWIVPVGNPSECVLNGTRLTCGSDWNYEVSGGSATPVEGGDGTVEEEQVEGEDEDAGEGEDAEEPVVENPYVVEGGTITDADGTVVFDFSPEAEQVYALAPSGRDNTWLFSDGQTIVAVKGREVVWQVELAEGSAGVNGFGSDGGPTWTTSGNVLLIAEPSGVLALDIGTGEEVWRIDTPVESWMTTDTTLVVSDGVNLTTYRFAGDRETEGEDAQSDTDSPAELPTTDEMMNVTLEVPDSCAALVGLPAGNASFTEGNADGADGWIQITGLAQSLADGELLSVVAFSCHSAETALPVIGAYSGEMELVAALDFAAALSVAPDAVESIQVRGQGSAVQVLVTGAGGALCEQCSPDTAAQVTMMWDGVGFTTSRVQDAPTWWDEVGNAEVVEAAGRGLAPEDLADITLVVPYIPGKDEGEWREVTFHDYVSEPIPWGDYANGGETIYYILEDETVEATINGEPYLFVSLLVSSGPGSLGTVCAISADKEVICALFPPVGLGTDHAWAVGIQVTGDEVSYGIDPGFVAPGGVVQRFDGTSFTFVR